MKRMFLFVVLVVQLYWRFRLGITRYFDIDEFAHLHWAYNFFSGMKPYKDFLYFFPPGFLWILSPIFFLTQDPVHILRIARVGEFGAFVGLVGIVFLLVRAIRDTHIALWTVLILSFLPIPYDKFLEIRPDTLAVTLAIGGIYFLVKGFGGISRIRQIGHIGRIKSIFFSGLLYGLAMVVVPKVVLFVVAAGVVIILQSLSYKTYMSYKSYRLKIIGIFLAGLAIPAVVTLLFFAWTGEFAKAIYLTTAFASDSSKILGAKFYMFPSHFFWPTDVYYGEGGFNASLVATLLMYLVGIVWGIKSFISFLDKPTSGESLGELLVSLTFLLNIYAFVRIVPLKHAQYFIPFAPFIALYVADFVMRIFANDERMNPNKKSFTREFIGWGLMIALLIFICWKGYTMYNRKSRWTNQKTFQELEVVQRTIPAGSYVWDLYGQTIVYKDPYYVCCIPYGQYQEAFGFPLPSLWRSLDDTMTKYIFAHNEGRLSVLPAQDTQYIKEHFVPIVNDPLILERR